jgi:hypothetical protein
MWGARGLFPPVVAMVVAVVTPVVFCAKTTEKCNEKTKTHFFTNNNLNNKYML